MRANRREPSTRTGPKLVVGRQRPPLRVWLKGCFWSRASMILWVILVGTGCSLDSLLNSEQLPPGVSDPAITQTPGGARRAYIGTLGLFRAAFGAHPDLSFVGATGLLSDELSNRPDASSPLDGRSVGNTGLGSGTYADLQKVRGQAGQAIGLLTDYLSEEPALAGHLYAIQGYAEVFLAELFCSGIPLSTLDYHGDFTYAPGSTTMQVLTHAVALFDTALVLAGNSARFVALARVGQARARLALGQYADAATAVAAVPVDYRYDETYGVIVNTPVQTNFFDLSNASLPFISSNLTVPDREGSNGMDWRTSGDPRTPFLVRSMPTFPFVTYFFPSKYDTAGTSSILLASGIEARLIEVEAALQASPDDGLWLTKLNTLRTDGTQDGGGVYNPGTGGVAGLAPLGDPGTLNGRVDLLFRERAFWLYLTGHRQGDLRRLLRPPYKRDQSDVYPVGPYGSTTYGSDVTIQVPLNEQASNPQYTGCFSSGA